MNKKNLSNILFTCLVAALSYLLCSFVALDFGWILETKVVDGNEYANPARILVGGVTSISILATFGDWK